MDSALDRLDAAAFLQIWQHFDVDDNGYIDGKQLDAFFQRMLGKSGMKREEITEDKIRRLRERFMSAYDAAADGRLQIEEERDGKYSFFQLATLMLPEDENFLLLFRRETPLDNSVEFMRIWRNYDTDSSGYISAIELKGFLQDLFLQHRKSITPDKLEEYTDTMMKMFDKNNDGRLDLNDLARILALKENFLLKFKMDPSISGTDLDKFRKALMGHCDINGDGKIQKNELALCLGLKLS
ncbi:Secretagogin [Collichthys lucidus]|uniref:Secretagogin n=1 Tax=Collichthys lucidus TaxID=240159 RepID=A0A4U5VL47_COLLU|nr:Secretagogin [Collichthys lucidus]